MQMRAWFGARCSSGIYGFPRLRVVEKRVALAERAAAAVLAAQPHGNPFEQQRAEGERLGERPIVTAAAVENLALPIEHDSLHLRQHVEVLRHASSGHRTICFKHLRRDRSRRRLRVIAGLEDRGRFLEPILASLGVCLRRFHFCERSLEPRPANSFSSFAAVLDGQHFAVDQLAFCKAAQPTGASRFSRRDRAG